jgi:hypothetical protein
VTVEGFKVHHAYLLAAALDHLRDGFPITAAVGSLDAIPEHPGAAAYRRGEALPDVGEGAR